MMRTMSGLPDDEIALLKEHFELFDLHSEGFIMKKDFAHAVRGYGVNLTEKSLEHAIRRYDNGKGQIMFADFVDFVARKMTNPGLNEADMLKAFAVFDTERKGLVSAQEMKGVLMKMGEMMTKKEIETIFKDADIDRNGMIKYKKFVSNLNELYEIFS